MVQVTPSAEPALFQLEEEPFHFPEVHHPIAVLLPESFRGGCSFGGPLFRLKKLKRSPARDRVLAKPARHPADGIVAEHHKGGE